MHRFHLTRDVIQVHGDRFLLKKLNALDPDLLDLVLDAGPIRLDLVDEGFLLWLVLLCQDYLLETHHLLLGCRGEILGVLHVLLLVDITTSSDTD